MEEGEKKETKHGGRKKRRETPNKERIEGK